MGPQTPIGQLSQQMAQGVPALDQNTMGSPNFDPSMQPPTPTAMPSGSPATMMHLHGALQRRGIDPTSIPQVGAQPPQDANSAGMVTLPIEDQNPQQPGVQVPPTEAELLIKAMTKRLDHHTKMTEKLMDTFLPQPEQAV